MVKKAQVRGLKARRNDAELLQQDEGDQDHGDVMDHYRSFQRPAGLKVGVLHGRGGGMGSA
jgi:hypothetical protein